MLIASLILNAALAFVAWRLKGSRSAKEAVKVVIQGGGGPDPTSPK